MMPVLEGEREKPDDAHEGSPHGHCAKRNDEEAKEECKNGEEQLADANHLHMSGKHYKFPTPQLHPKEIRTKIYYKNAQSIL